MSHKPNNNSSSGKSPYTKVPSDHGNLMVAMRPVTRQTDGAVGLGASTTQEQQQNDAQPQAMKQRSGHHSPPRTAPTAAATATPAAGYSWSFSSSNVMSPTGGHGVMNRAGGIEFRPNSTAPSSSSAHTVPNVGSNGKLLLTPIAQQRKIATMMGKARRAGTPSANNSNNSGEVDASGGGDNSDPDELTDSKRRGTSPPQQQQQRNAATPAHLKERLRLHALYPLSTANSTSPGKIGYKQGKRTQLQLMGGAEGPAAYDTTILDGGGWAYDEDGRPSTTAASFMHSGGAHLTTAQLAPAMQTATGATAKTTTTTTTTTLIGADHDYFKELRAASSQQKKKPTATTTRSFGENGDDDDGPDFTIQRGTPLRSHAMLSSMAGATSSSGGGGRGFLNSSHQRAGTSQSSRVSISAAGGVGSSNNSAGALTLSLQQQDQQRGLLLAEPPSTIVDFPLYGETKAFLAAELRFLNDSDKAGRLGVYREAFSKVIDGFRAFGPLLEEIRVAYEDRLAELEELSKIALHGDPSIAIEKEKYLRLQDEALDSMEKGRLQKNILRKRIVDAEQAKMDAVADVSAELTVLRETRVELNERAINSSAAVRDLEEMLITFQETNKALNKRCDELQREKREALEDTQKAVDMLQDALSKERQDHYDTRKRLTEDVAELKLKAKQLEDVHIDPERYEAMCKRAKDVEEVALALERKTQWLAKDLALKATYEPPIDWSMTSPAAVALHEQHPEKTTEDLLRLLGEKLDRAVASEREMVGRWGHVLALSAMTPYGGYGSRNSLLATSSSALSLHRYGKYFSPNALPQLPLLVNTGAAWTPATPLLQSAAAANAVLNSGANPLTANGAVPRKSILGINSTMSSSVTPTKAAPQAAKGIIAASASATASAPPSSLFGTKGAAAIPSSTEGLSTAAIAAMSSFLVTVIVKPTRDEVITGAASIHMNNVTSISSMNRSSSAASSSPTRPQSSGTFLTSTRLHSQQQQQPSSSAEASPSAALPSPLPNPLHLVSLLRHRKDLPEAWMVTKQSVMLMANGGGGGGGRPHSPTTPANTSHNFSTNFGHMNTLSQQPSSSPSNNGGSSGYVSAYEEVSPATIREQRAALTLKTHQCNPIANVTPSVVRQLVAGAFVALTSNNHQTFLEACDFVFRRYYERRSFAFFDGASYPYYPNDYIAERNRQFDKNGQSAADRAAAARLAAEKAEKSAALRSAIATLKKGGAPVIPSHLTTSGGGGGNSASAHNGAMNGTTTLGSILTSDGPSSLTSNSNNMAGKTARERAAAENSTAHGTATTSYYQAHHLHNARHTVVVEDTPSFPHLVATILHVWGQLSISEPFYRALLQALVGGGGNNSVLAPRMSSAKVMEQQFASIFGNSIPTITDETLKGYSNSFVNMLRCSVGRLLRLQLDRSNENGGGSAVPPSTSIGTGSPHQAGGFGTGIPPPASPYCPTTTDGSNIAFVPNGLTVTDIIHTLSCDVLSKSPDQWAMVRIALNEQLVEQYHSMSSLYVSVLSAVGVDPTAVSTTLLNAEFKATSLAAAAAAAGNTAEKSSAVGKGKDAAKGDAGGGAPPVAQQQQAFSVADERYPDGARSVGGEEGVKSPAVPPPKATNSLQSPLTSPKRGGAASSAAARDDAVMNGEENANASAPAAVKSSVVALPTPDSFALRRHYLQPNDIMGYPTIGEASPLLLCLLDQFWGDVTILTHCVSSVLYEYTERCGGVGGTSSSSSSASLSKHIGEGITINQAVALLRHSHLLSANTASYGSASAMLAAIGAGNEALVHDAQRLALVGGHEGAAQALERVFAAAEADLAAKRGGGLSGGDRSNSVVFGASTEGGGGGGGGGANGAMALLSTDIEASKSNMASMNVSQEPHQLQSALATGSRSGGGGFSSSKRVSIVPPLGNGGSRGSSPAATPLNLTAGGDAFGAVGGGGGSEMLPSSSSASGLIPPDASLSDTIAGRPKPLVPQRFLQLVLQRFDHAAQVVKGGGVIGGYPLVPRPYAVNEAPNRPKPVTPYAHLDANQNSFLTVAMPPTEASWTITDLLAQQILYSAAGQCAMLQDVIGSSRIGHVFVQHGVTMLPKLHCFESDPTPSYVAGVTVHSSPQHQQAAQAALTHNRCNQNYALHGGAAQGCDDYLHVGLLLPAIIANNNVAAGTTGANGNTAPDLTTPPPTGSRGGNANNGAAASAALVASLSQMVLRTFALSAAGCQDIYCDAAVGVDSSELLLIPPPPPATDASEDAAAASNKSPTSPSTSPRFASGTQGGNYSLHPTVRAANHGILTGSSSTNTARSQRNPYQSHVSAVGPTSTLYNGKSTAPSLYHLLHRHVFTATAFLWSQKGTSAGHEAKRMFHARYLSFVAARDYKNSLVDYSGFSPLSNFYRDSPPYRTLQFCQMGNSAKSVASLQPMMDASLGFTTTISPQLLVRSIIKHVPLVPQYYNVLFEQQRATTAAVSAVAQSNNSPQTPLGEDTNGKQRSSSLTPPTASSLLSVGRQRRIGSSSQNNPLAISASTTAKELRDREREHELSAKAVILSPHEMAPSQQPMILFASL